MSETHSRPDTNAPEESLDDLYENAPCSYVSVLPDGSFAKCNHTFLVATGYARDDLLAGMRFQDLLTIAGKIFYETHFAPLLRMQGFVHEIAFDLVCRDGQSLPVLINASQKLDAAGNPLVTRIIIMISRHRRQYERDLQAARQKAEQALQLRDQFMILISHELKTPLTTIIGQIQLLRRRVYADNTLNARDQRTLATIADQSNRLNRMIVSLLDISRIETGRLSLELAPMDLAALVRRVVDEVQPILGERVIKAQGAGQPVIMQGDELRLEQVVQNLIQNAAKYSAPGLPIDVTITQHEARVSVAVQDRGIGIPQAALNRLFDRFYRATNAQEGSAGGMGIGLYVVKEIVDLHGGQVRVESAEGQGSTFTVCLPR